MMKNYGYQGMEKNILLLHHYNMKGVGVGDNGTDSAILLKEMVVKMFL
jgi:DNA polymerase-3 subunit delta